MADLETIRRLRITAKADGLDDVVRALERVGKAYEIVGAGASVVGVQSDETARKVLSASDGMARIAARLDPAEKAAQNFAKSLNVVGRAAESGYFNKMADGAERFRSTLTALQREYEKMSRTGDGYFANLQKEIAARDPATRVVATAESQQRFNQGAGIADRLGRYTKGSAEESMSAFIDADAAAVDRLASKYDRAQKMLEAYNVELAEVNTLLARGSIGADQHARYISEISRAYSEASGAAAKMKADLQDEIRLRDTAAKVTAAAAAQQRFNQGAGVSDRLGRYSAGSAEESASTFAAMLAEQDRQAAKVEIARREASAKTAAANQEAINERLGVRAPRQDAGDSAAAFLEADAEAVRRLRTEYNQYAIALERKDKAQAQSNALLARGAITTEEHAIVTTNIQKTYDATTRALDGSNTSMSKWATGAGLARHEMINLGRQAQDVFVSLAAGQPIMTVLIQQGTQIADIFATTKGGFASFFGQLVSGAARFATSLTGVIAGVVAFGAAAAYATNRYLDGQREVETSLIGIGRGSGQTVESINRVAEAAANAGRISRASAREIAGIFAGTGSIDRSMVNTDTIDTLSRGYGVLTNQSQTEAAKGLASALASPTAGAAELEKRLGKLSDAQMEFIKNAEASGNKLEAQRALLAAISPALSEAADKTGIFARAWEAVTKAASDAADAIGRALSGPSSLEEQLAGAQNTLMAMQRSRQRYGALGVFQGDLNNQNAVVSDLQERLRRQGQLRSEQTRDAASSNLSRQAGGAIRGMFGDETRRQDLENNLALLEKTFGDSSAMSKLGPLADLVGQGIERLRGSLANFETTNQRIAKDAQLQIQTINAYTLAERSAVEAERARVEAIRAGRGELQAGVEAEQARTRVITEANRQLRDTARDLSDQGRLIGLSPFQRSLQENRNVSQRERDTLSMGASEGATALPQTTAAVRGLDATFAENLKKLMAAVPGLGITSGFRTTEEQARLYAQKGPGWAAKPGTSRHESGLAADLNYKGSGQLPQWIRDEAAKYGIHFPLAERARNPEPWHAEPMAGGGRRVSAGGGVGANDNQAARDANVLREAYEGWNTPLANAERQLTAQIGLQRTAAQTFFMTAGEITKAQEQQRLFNEYAAAGIPITESLRAGIEAYGTRAGQAAEEVKRIGDAQKAMTDAVGLARDGVKGFYSDIRGGASGIEALQNQLNKLADKLFDMAINDLFGKAIGGGGGNGFFSSFFSSMFGGGSGLGTTPGSGGLYADGGYTGSGSKWQPAGTVHKGEVVWSQADVRRAGGVSVVESMRRGLPGYEDGGYVGTRPPANSNSASAGNWNVNVINNASNANVETKQNEDGSLDVYVDAIEGNIARKAVRRRGSLSTALRNADTLRG